MAKGQGQIERGELEATAGVSKIDKLTGKHTTPIIVGSLIILILIGYIFLYCYKSPLEAGVTTGFFSLMSGLVGFFVSSASKN